ALVAAHRPAEVARHVRVGVERREGRFVRGLPGAEEETLCLDHRPGRYGPLTKATRSEAALGNLHPAPGPKSCRRVRWRALHPVASLFAAPNRVCDECASRAAKL